MGGALLGDLGAAGKGEGIGGYIPGDGAARADEAAVAQLHRGDELAVRTHEDVPADEAAVLVEPVVVAM